MAAFIWQAGLAVGFTALLIAALVIGWRRPHLRALAFASGTVAAPHAAYYVLFVWFSDVLDASQTMLFSIALRYEVLGMTTLLLAMPLARTLRKQWKA